MTRLTAPIMTRRVSLKSSQSGQTADKTMHPLSLIIVILDQWWSIVRIARGCAAWCCNRANRRPLCLEGARRPGVTGHTHGVSETAWYTTRAYCPEAVPWFLLKLTFSAAAMCTIGHNFGSACGTTHTYTGFSTFREPRTCGSSAPPSPASVKWSSRSVTAVMERVPVQPASTNRA